MGTEAHARVRGPRRALVVFGARAAAVAAVLAAAACGSSPAPPGSAPRSTAAHGSLPSVRSVLTFPGASAPASQPASGLAARLLDGQSAPSGYQVLPSSAFTVATGSVVTGAPTCSTAAFGNPYAALTAVPPVEVAERGIYGPNGSGGFFWRGTEELFGYQGDGAQRALAALRQWVARCSLPQPGGATAGVSLGSGPGLGDESLTLRVSMNVRISSGGAVAPFDSVIVRAGAVIFVLSEQGVPTTGGPDDNSARLTAVANAAYARFQRS